MLKTLYLALAGLLASSGMAAAGRNLWTTSGPASVVGVFQVSSQTPTTLYAGGADGLYRSADNGRTWMNLAGPLLGRNVLSLAIDPAEEGRLYCGTNLGLYRSTDGGLTWSQVSGPGSGILSLAAGPAGSGLVCAGTFGRGVFASEDRGSTWQASEGNMAEAIVFALATTPLDARRVYAGTASGLFVSRDAGRTWATLGVAVLGQQSVRAIYLSAADPDLILVGTFGGGVFRSGDGGQTWAARNAGLGDLSVRGLTADPRAEQVLYAATATGGFFRSRDSGGQWEALNAGLTALTTRAVLVHPANPDQLLGSGPGPGVWEFSLAPEPRLQVQRTPLDFGTVAVGAVQRLELSLANSGGAELLVSSLGVGRSSLFSVAPSSLSIPAGGTASVELRFQPRSRGVERDTLTIRSSDPAADLVRIALSGTGVQADLRALPSAVNFGLVRIGSFRDTTVVLSNAGNAALTLRNAFVEDSAFRVLSFQTRLLQPGERLPLALRFVPLRSRGVSARLVVVTDAADLPRLEVPLDGVGTAPDIAVAPTALDFGSVDLRGSKVLPVQVSNNGNAELRIQRLDLRGTAFRVSPSAPLVLSPGQGQTFQVSFLPLASGLQQDTLKIASDMPGPAGLLPVPLTGSGGAVELDPQAPLAAGAGPVSMIAVDLDQDGDKDLALADSARGEVRVLRNDGTGHFPQADQAVYPGSEAAYQPWDEPVALAAADLFGQGPDLVVADRVARSISILANDGQGHFGLRREDVFIGHAVTDVRAADLDADGDVDLVVADGDAPSITLLFNNGQGSFNARASRPVQAGPRAVAAANLDADGHNDLVVANQEAGTVSVLLNDRQRGFQARQDYPVGLGPVALALVDYDADGDNDILVANQGSLDVALLLNDGQGHFQMKTRIPTGLAPADLALSDLTADVFSDLVVAGNGRPFVLFWENAAGRGFVSEDIPTVDTPARAVDIVDLDGDSDNDLVVLSTVSGSVQVFLNADTRRLDPPRPPTGVQAQDLGRDLGRQIAVEWQAPELDEQIGRTTEYTVFRSRSSAGTFAEIGRSPAGTRRFVDVAATLADTFYYFVRAGNAQAQSEPSDTVSAVSSPAPFFELELVDEPRLSVGDTLTVKAFITPAGHPIAGVSLYLSFADSALYLVPADTGQTVTPFRPEPGLGPATILENRLHRGFANKVDVSLGGVRIPPGVNPVLLGELRFVTQKDTVTAISIDDEPLLNRRSAVVEEGSGEWILPFIPSRPTLVSVRDFQVSGQVELEGRTADNLGLQVTLSFVDAQGQELVSPLNDEDRLQPGIQATLDRFGNFRLAQIPRGRYQVFAKAPNHLQGQVQTDTTAVGDSLRPHLLFRWIRPDSTSTLLLPAGDANSDNRVNLADFGLLVRYFGATAARAQTWAQARQADFNGDGAVTIDDFFLLAQNFGEVGMEPVRAALRPARPGGRVWVDSNGALRASGLGPIRGIAVRVEDARAEYDLRNTVWASQGLKVQRWSKEGGVWIAGALAASLGGVSGEGVLLQLYLPDSEGRPQVREVEVLGADGQVVSYQPGAGGELPGQTTLLPNYPNPCNPSTTIPFVVSGTGSGRPGTQVRLEVYDLLGQPIRLLLDEYMPAGRHEVVWDGRDDQGHRVGSGLYLYQLRTGSLRQTRALLLIY